MRRFTRPLLAVLGVVLLGSIITLVPQKNASSAPAPAPVIVTNTPLPVSGNVNASQSGVWNVGINNLPSTQNVSFNGAAQPISFSNTATTPIFNRDVDNSARNSVLGSCDLPSTSGPGTQFCNVQFSTSSGSNFTSVPTGYRLVIEFVSGEVDVPTGTTIVRNFGIRTTIGNSYTVINFDPRFAGTDSTVDVWRFSQQTRIYEDPGSTVVLGAGTGAQIVPFSVFGQVTGYLVSQ